MNEQRQAKKGKFFTGGDKLGEEIKTDKFSVCILFYLLARFRL